MYRKENCTELDPSNCRGGLVVERRRAELVIVPREAPLPGEELRSTIALPAAPGRLDSLLTASAATLLFLVVAAVYARDILALFDLWLNEPGLSYALAIPVFAAFLLWFRRDERPLSWQGSWWGLAIVLVGGSADVAARWGYYSSVRPLALLLTLGGICVLVGGRAAWHWCWPALIFLGFALPLPARLLADESLPVERWTAAASAYLLVALGFPAVAVDGELMLGDAAWGDSVLGGGRLAVADAWSGLGGMVACLTVCSAVALIVQARPWERWLIVLSALPIALVGNVIRLTLAAAFQGPVGNVLLGAPGSWMMVTLVLGLLWIERTFLSRALACDRVPSPLGLPCRVVQI